MGGVVAGDAFSEFVLGEHSAGPGPAATTRGVARAGTRDTAGTHAKAERAFEERESGPVWTLWAGGGTGLGIFLTRIRTVRILVCVPIFVFRRVRWWIVLYVVCRVWER